MLQAFSSSLRPASRAMHLCDLVTCTAHISASPLPPSPTRPATSGMAAQWSRRLQGGSWAAACQDDLFSLPRVSAHRQPPRLHQTCYLPQPLQRHQPPPRAAAAAGEMLHLRAVCFRIFFSLQYRDKIFSSPLFLYARGTSKNKPTE